MQLQNFYAQDANGNIVPRAECTLFISGTGTLATGLQDAAGNSLSNPFFANSFGLASVSAPQGVYDLQMLSGLLQSKIQVQFIDAIKVASDAASALASSASAKSSADSAKASADSVSAALTAPITAIRPLTPEADRIAVYTSATAAQLYPMTSEARTFIAATSKAAQRTSIGLGSVDNTTDINKPVSTATRAAIDSISINLANTSPTQGAALVGRSWQGVNSVAELKQLSTKGPSKFAYTSGYYSQGDGGAGMYYVPANVSGLSGNDVDVIAASDGGFWKLNHNNSIDIRQGGAAHNTDCTLAITRCIAAVSSSASLNRGGKVIIPPIWANFSGTINIENPFITIEGLTGGPAPLLRSLTPSATAIKTTGNYTTLKNVEITYATPATGGAGIEISATNFNLVSSVVSNSYNGIYFRQGSAHVIRDVRLNDCVNTGFLFQGDSGFINDILIDDWFCGTTDNSKFSLGQFRFVGRIEALMLGKGDGIGGKRSVTCDAQGSIGLRYSTFNSCFWDSTDFGAIFDGGGYNNFVNCWASNGRGTSSSGIAFTNSSHFSISNGNFFNSGGPGLRIDSCTEFTILSTDASSNSVDSDGSASGITINNSKKFTLSSSGGNGSRQFYGVLIDNSSDFSATSNRFGLNKNGPIAIGSSCSNFEISSNRGYITLNLGSGSLPANATSVTVTHGLSRTPALSGISIQANGATNSNLYVSSVSATSFVVSTLSSNGGATPFSWRADAQITA